MATRAYSDLHTLLKHRLSICNHNSDTFRGCLRNACRAFAIEGSSVEGWKQFVSIIHDDQCSIWNYNRSFVRQSAICINWFLVPRIRARGTWAEVPFMYPKQRQRTWSRQTEECRQLFVSNAVVYSAKNTFTVTALECRALCTYFKIIACSYFSFRQW